MDLLGQILSRMRTQGRIWGKLELSSPYALVFPHEFGVFLSVMEGETWLSIGNGSPFHLKKGDFIFLPCPADFALRSGILLTGATPLNSQQATLWAREKHLVHEGDGGNPTILITGCFDVASPEAHFLVRELPPLLLVRAGKSNDRITALLEMMHREILLPAPGGSVMIDRLSELLLLESIRQTIIPTHGTNTCRTANHMPDGAATGWLRALGNPQLNRVLSLVHEDPGADWTLSAMARIAGMSRSTFVERFRRITGKTPLEHLTEWRMAHAATLLIQNSDLRIAVLAERVGYRSERAFRKAFVKIMNVPPKTYHKQILMAKSVQDKT